MQTSMTNEEMAEAIVAFVTAREHATFAELVKRDLIERGHVAIHLPGYENIITWSNMSQQSADVMTALLSQRIYPHPCESFLAGVPLAYMVDGVLLNMPIAWKLRQYKRPHWAPVTLCTFPHRAAPPRIHEAWSRRAGRAAMAVGGGAGR